MEDFTEYKMKLDKYFESNYDKLRLYSTNILLSRLKTDEHSDTLVISAYEYMIDNYEKIKDSKSNIESIIVNYMTKQVAWKGTDFKKNYIYKKDVQMNDEIDIKDELDDLEDVLKEEYEFQNKLNQVMINIENLDQIDQRLYEIVFVLGHNNSGKLSRFTGIPRTTCWYMIQELKEKLKK